MQRGSALAVPPWLRRHAPVVLLALLLLLLALLFEWNWLKGPIERRVEAHTGREFHIDSDLEVDGGWGRITARAGGVRLANAGWAKEPQMLVATAPELELALWPLFRGKVVLPAVRAQDVTLRLEREKDGSANWTFARPPRAQVRQLEVGRGELVVRDAVTRTDLRLDIHTGTPTEAGGFAPLVAKGGGRYRGEPVELQGTVDSPLTLRNPALPYRLDLRARAGATRGHVAGQLAAPIQLSGIDVRLELSGATLAHLYPLLGLAFPDTPPYRFAGQLVQGEQRWSYRGFEGKMGDSDMRGDARVDTGGKRPKFTAELASRHLDFDDLAGLVGAAPATGKGETASPQQKSQRARERADSRVLPERAYDLVKLRAMDADVTLRAEHVESPKLPVERLHAHLLLEAGRVQVDPLELGVAGGEIDGRVVLDGSGDPIALDTELRARRLQFGKLMPDAELARASVGRVGGRLQLRGKGNSVAAMLAGADGEVGLAMGRGRVSNLLIEMAGIDIAESLRFMLGKDRQIPIRCAYADFGVEGGIMKARALVFDTTDTAIHGTGTVSLREERFDLRLHAKPKDMSPISLRSPLQVTGSFKDPDIGPAPGPLALRAVATAVLYAIAPPAALLATIDAGPGEDADCSADAAKKRG